MSIIFAENSCLINGDSVFEKDLGQKAYMYLNCLH